MEIKPIKLIQRVQSAEIPETRIDKNLPSIPAIKPPSGNWKFVKGQIILNGQNVARMIEQGAKQPTMFWSKLANDLEQFRKFYIRKKVKKRRRKVGDQIIEEEVDPTGELGHLSALVDAYIAKIMRILKKRYDEKEDGLSYMLDENGQLTINGMNVTSFIHMARSYPSQKARVFLKGLKNRLSIILSNKGSNPNYEKIRETTLTLFEEIDEEIERIVEKERLLENK